MLLMLLMMLLPAGRAQPSLRSLPHSSCSISCARVLDLVVVEMDLASTAAARLAEIRARDRERTRIAIERAEAAARLADDGSGATDAYSRHAAAIRARIDAGEPLTDLIESGLDALQLAATAADVELLRTIVQRGQRFDINRASAIGGLTALHLACSSPTASDDEALEMAEALIDNGADSERQTRDSMWSGSGEALDAAAIAVYSSGGRTALHLVAERGHVRVCRMLVEKAHAEWLVWDNDGMSPAQLALLSGHTAVWEYLSQLESEASVTKQQVHSLEQAALLGRQAQAQADSMAARERLAHSLEQLRRKRISRRRRAEKERLARETLAIVQREFDWQGLDKVAPKDMLDPQFYAAIEKLRTEQDDSALRALLYRPVGTVHRAEEHEHEHAAGVPCPLDINGFRMFTSEFCERLIAALDRFNAFAAASPHLTPPRRSGSKYGVVLNSIGFRDMFDRILHDYIQPLARLAYPELRTAPLETQHTFLVRYAVGLEVRQHTHADDSNLTVNICLGRDGFAGGRLFFYGLQGPDTPRPPTYPEPGIEPQPLFWLQHKVHHGVFHLGRQYHGAEELTHGERVNLIMWCRQAHDTRMQAAIERGLQTEEAANPSTGGDDERRVTSREAMSPSELEAEARKEAKSAAAAAAAAARPPPSWQPIADAVQQGLSDSAILERVHEWLHAAGASQSTDDEAPSSWLCSTDSRGRTILHFLVIASDRSEALSAILEHRGVDVDLLDNDGLSCVHYAAVANDAESLARLLPHTRNVDLPCSKNVRTRLVEIQVAGRTALHLALLQSPPAFECARLLLQAGSNPQLEDSQGHKPRIELLQ